MATPTVPNLTANQARRLLRHDLLTVTALNAAEEALDRLTPTLEPLLPPRTRRRLEMARRHLLALWREQDGATNRAAEIAGNGLIFLVPTR